MEPTSPTKTDAVNEIVCKNCGAPLLYAPGTHSLKCQHCFAENEIAQPEEVVVVENDFRAFVASANVAGDACEEVHSVSCTACGAATTLRTNVTSDKCPFCDTPIMVKTEHVQALVKPRYLLPFSVERTKAQTLFSGWIKKLWFAPNDLRMSATTTDKLNGLYIPYWTYDATTESSYTGQRGTNHVQHYSTTVNGKRVTQTRTVIRWHSVSGCVNKQFDDVLVVASRSLPEKYADRLEPWDLGNLVEYNENYCAGFTTETYRVNVESGFDKAKVSMDRMIHELIKRDIGGDHQRISSVNTTWNNITFKHILLPIWLSAYRHKDKVYRFMINGRTGEVQGERPWSVVKITLAALTTLAVLAGLYAVFQPYIQ